MGVTEATAETNGYEAYTPKSGYKGISAQAQLEYTFLPNWSLLGGIGIEHYGEIMSESPLIKIDGTDTTYEASIGIVRRF